MHVPFQGDIIGMVKYEKQVEQEAAYPIAYPIPISYKLSGFLFMPHCPVTVVGMGYAMGYAASFSTSFP